jgi:hypothetical protein
LPVPAAGFFGVQRTEFCTAEHTEYTEDGSTARVRTHLCGGSREQCAGSCASRQADAAVARFVFFFLFQQHTGAYGSGRFGCNRIPEFAASVYSVCSVVK